MGGALHLGEVELGLAHGPDGGHDDGDVVRQAAGHHCSRGHLLHARHAVRGSHDAQLEIGVEPGGEGHHGHPLRRGDDHRQAVGEPERVKPFECVGLAAGLQQCHG